MAGQKQNPPGCAPAGSLDSSLLSGFDGQAIAQNGFDGQADISLAATDARIELLVDDIGDNCGAMSAYLNCVLAHRDAGDPQG
jgi:hypothetical protein